MIKSLLTTALTTAGCTKILYESDKLSGITSDQIEQTDIVGYIIEPNNLTFDIKSNGILRVYSPHYIEILAQVKPEEAAANNEILLESLALIAEKFIYQLVISSNFKKIVSIQAVKVLENKYDANVIGWSLPITLNYLEMKENC
jgi:hypothetical protein